MREKTILQIADGLGLTVEAVNVPDHDRAVRVFKGANQVFIGTEDAVREFLSQYEKERPALFAGSMYDYKE